MGKKLTFCRFLSLSLRISGNFNLSTPRIVENAMNSHYEPVVHRYKCKMHLHCSYNILYTFVHEQCKIIFHYTLKNCNKIAMYNGYSSLRTFLISMY